MKAKLHGFRLAAKRVRDAFAVMMLVASTADTASSQQETAATAQALADWLECEYCEHGELEAVTHLGQAIVPGLIAALDQGLSPVARDDLRRALQERYDQLVEQSKKNPHATIGVTKEKFVELYLSQLDAQHRVRGAQALAAIGGERARTALEAAATQAPGDDVRAAVRESLSKLGH